MIRFKELEKRNLSFVDVAISSVLGVKIIQFQRLNQSPKYK